MSTGAPKDEARKKAQGARLKAARIQHGHRTATEGAAYLAKALHRPVSYDTYAQYENGRLSILNVASEFALALDVATEWLIEARNPPEWAVGEPLDEAERLGPAYHYLRAWRLDAGISEAELAERAGTTADQIQRWEAGDLAISDHALRRLATALDTTPGMILDVDPGAVPRNALKTWLELVRGQPRFQTAVDRLRTARG